MGNINGTENKSSRSWDEEEGLYSVSHPRGGRDARRYGGILGDKQERVNREGGQKTDFRTEFGSSVSGGVVAQLIFECRQQIADKRSAVKSLEAEINALDFRVNQLETIQSILKASTELAEKAV